MELEYEIERIRASPSDFLTESCVLALGAFLSGFRTTNPACRAALDALADDFEGPSAADVCTRAYLCNLNTERALHQVLDAVSARKAHSGKSGAVIEIPRDFVDWVREPILSGKTGLVFAEPTMMWCANYWKGFLAGLEVTDPMEAARERANFETFEQRLSQRYLSRARAPWYAIIRVYEGADQTGLRAFISLWDEFTHSSA